MEAQVEEPVGAAGRVLALHPVATALPWVELRGKAPGALEVARHHWEATDWEASDLASSGPGRSSLESCPREPPATNILHWRYTWAAPNLIHPSWEVGKARDTAQATWVD
eukprot:Skav219811  [mRNA]  locus=scaffold147:280655:281690:+ [translate_table: standard]